MTLFSALMRLVILAPVALWLSGCYPDNPTDEEKDPHFLAGKSRSSSLDYDGAISAFESALASNPKSASAHLELGLLCEEKKNDYAAAIYHYQRHLELKPESNMAETLKQRIYSCKLELAKTVPFALVSRQVQDEMRKLYTSNALLHERVEQLKAQLVDQATAFSNRLAAAVLAVAPAPAPQFQSPAQPERRAPPAERRAPEPERRSAAPEKKTPSVALRNPSASTGPLPASHTVRSGETLASISRKYNVQPSSLQIANPGTDFQRLKPGQLLNLPSRN